MRANDASAHLILAHSPDDYVYHAREALRLYELLYTDLPTGRPPTENQLASKEALVTDAKRVLEKALQDEEEYAPDEMDEETAKAQRLDMMEDLYRVEEEETSAGDEDREPDLVIGAETTSDDASTDWQSDNSHEMLLGPEHVDEDDEEMLEWLPDEECTEPVPFLPTPPVSRGRDGTGSGTAAP